jgi:3-methylcrotonyl-CoA carboxylase beta subunit
MPEDLKEAMARTRQDYERWLDAKYAAARGHVDAIIDPKQTREVLTQALEMALMRPRSESTVMDAL